MTEYPGGVTLLLNELRLYWAVASAWLRSELLERPRV